MRLKTINTIPHYLSLLILQENCSLQSTNYLYHHKIKKMNTSCPPDSRSRAAARRPVRLRAFRTQNFPAPPGDGGAGKFFYISTHVFAGKKTRTPLLKCASWERQLAAGGDGGSRTRVRKRVPAAFYERSRALKIPLESHRTAGNLLR